MNAVTNQKIAFAFKAISDVFLLLQNSLASHVCIIICHVELLRNGYNALLRVSVSSTEDL